MRGFVALPLPDDCRNLVADELAPLQRRHDQLRWTSPQGWHLTLAFLGELGDEAEAVAAVSAAAAGVEPFELATTDGGRFGDAVLWLGVDAEPPGALDTLARRIREELGGRGIEIDEGSFRPHVTLARSRRGRERVGRSLVDAVRIPSRRWRADRLELWESILGRGPARYEVVASVAFSG